MPPIHPTNKTAPMQHTAIVRCTLFKNWGAPRLASVAKLGNSVAVFDAIFSGEISMQVNDKAPDFTLQDENGKEVALKDLRGKTVVLYFYPRANTPG